MNKEKLKGYVQLIRPYGIFIAMMPIIGAISNGIFNNLFLLLLVGIFANSFGFVQNDYFDIEIDKKSGYVAKRPLASGLISKKEALIFMFFLSFIPFVIVSIFFTYYSLAFLILFFIFYTIYNKFSKKFAWMEYSLGLAGTMIFLCGAFSQKENISSLSLLLSILPTLKYVFNVGVSANLKDIKYDLLQGVKTTPAIFGAKVSDTIYLPKSFIIYAYTIKIIFIFIAGIALFFAEPTFISISLFIVTTFALIYTINKIFENIENRKEMLFYAEIHEILTYVLIASIIYDYVAKNYNAFLSFALVILPPLWILFCLWIFFGGKPLE